MAYSRHYPAIHWLTSYSEYMDLLADWFKENVDERFLLLRTEIVRLLQEESKLMEIVKLIGGDVLPDEQKLILEIARVIRLGFLQQNAYHESDTYVPLVKQFKMMETIIYLYNTSRKLIEKGIPMSVLREKEIFEEVIKMKYTIGNDEMEKFEEIRGRIDSFYKELYNEYTQT